MQVEEPTSLAGNVNGDTAPLHMQNTACTDVGNIEIGFKRQVPSKDELLLAFMYFDRTGGPLQCIFICICTDLEFRVQTYLL